MSEFLERLQAGAESGKSHFGEAEAPQAPLPTPNDEFQMPDGSAIVEEAEAYPILGNVVGISAEIGTGLYMTKQLHRSQQFLKVARGVKAASVAAMVTPEPATTVGGMATFALSEAAIWGASNLIGQSIRKAYGVQDNISAGEVLASSVFGVGLVSKGGQTVISLGDGLAQMKAWGKGNELFVNGVKSFVSGATLGIAETALRQEAQLLLNERENRDAVEYLIGGAAGGGFNTLFDVFSRTGKWGQAKAKKITENAKASLEAKALELEARLETTTPRARPKLKLAAKRIRRSIESVDDLGQQLDTAAEALNNPKQAQTEQPKELESLAPTEKVPDNPLDEVVEKAPEQKPSETIETSTPPEESTLTPRQQEIEKLGGKLADLDSDNMHVVSPEVGRATKRLYENILSDLNVSARKLSDNTDPEDVDTMLQAVKDIRELNATVKTPIDTTFGRTGQSLRRDSDKYSWSDMYSLRSQREDANYALLENTLEDAAAKTKGKEDDLSSVRELLDEATRKDEYSDPLEKPKKPANEGDKKPSKKGDKKDLTPEEQAAKAQEQLQKKKKKLQEELEAKQKEFTGQKDLEDPKATKAQNPEIKDLQERIKWYNDAEAEVKTVATLEKRLAELAGIEGAGDMSTLRKTTQQNLKPPSKASPKVQELNTKITESKARMKQKLKEIDEVGKKMEKEDHQRFRATLLKDIETALYSSMEVDGASKVTKTFRWLAQSRQMALINQLPSALAGVPTGGVALAREVNRGVANYVTKKFSGNELAGELAKADLGQALNNFAYLFSKDNWRAVGRTLKENQSATDPRKAGRMDDETFRVNIPRGEAALVARARRRAEKATAAQKGLINKAGANGGETTLERLNRLYFLGQSGGVRLIQGLDEAFKRPLILGRVKASARKEAIMEMNHLKDMDGVAFTPADIDTLAAQKYEAALIDSDGLSVLRANHEYLEEVDLARQELLFAANSDNIEEVVTPYSEKMVQSLKQLAGSDHPISFAINAIMPYIGVPIRGVYKGLSWTTALPRMAGTAVDGNALGNPYTAKIQRAQDELKVLEKLEKERGDTPFTDQGKEAVNTLEGGKQEILERIDRMDARRIQYNADTMADALMTVELAGVMTLAAAAGEGTGSMTFLSEDQKKKMELTGTKPFKLFGMDYKAIGPAAFPLVVAGDLRQFAKIRKVEAQTGTTILDEDMGWGDVILKSIVSLAKEQPLSSGIKQVTEMVGDDEQRKIATSSMMSSYTVVPAFMKKAVQQYNNTGRMVDLKGSTFSDRLAYGALGMGISNYKTDYFGHDVEDPRGFVQNNVMRQWPEAEKTRTELENIIGSDLVGTIQEKPAYITTGVRMKDFVDPRGVTLTYQFDQELKETTIRGKTMIEAVQDKIYSNRWSKKFDAPAEADGDIMVNLGLVELNDLMRSYYDKAKKNVLKDSITTSQFINKDEETLETVLERFNNEDFLPDSGPVNLADVLNPQ
jgi:hypothetical protein